MADHIFLGTAGWSVPRDVADAFPAEGSGLERYAARFNAVEINSTFYRSHRPQTFERWRAATPGGFQFAVKVSRAITHEARLIGCGPRLAQFFDEIAPLAGKLGPILVQLPPSLAFDPGVAADFLAELRRQWGGPVALEPRHASWFGAQAAALLAAHRIAQVAADPARVAAAGVPGGDPSLAYWRLHGSPRMYYSPYGPTALEALALAIAKAHARDAWCVFDNTASGAAAANALTLAAKLSRPAKDRTGPDKG
ncbi:DUF72 domain-containing protein [Phenylobacterium sp.]|uniref:DUF72 domain-containing protein n=1 Tax=Phenylobacterium sp. TaxID=1871053 RepID=UPI0011FBA224|nr:DUF72 domain-containing protein [Phenylobacterium sp.]THD61280.1 MAG: DUF72 domain-containing protein [Phenylobacterium sp.]